MRVEVALFEILTNYGVVAKYVTYLIDDVTETAIVIKEERRVK